MQTNHLRPTLRTWIWTAGVVVLAGLVAFLWSISDARATSSTTASRPPAATGTPAAGLTSAWSAPGDPVPEQPVQGGRVIVGSRHGITALDPLSGKQVWHYTRSNARMCDVTAVDGLAVAVFAKPGTLCDEAVALHADTGVRAWTRNVDFRPDARLVSAPGHVVAFAPTGVVDLDPAGDNIRWRWNAPKGCRIAEVTPGTSGTAVLQRCPGTSAARVVLLDALGGTVHWTADVPASAGVPVQLAGADGPISVVAGDRLQLLDASSGALRQSVPLPGTTNPAAQALETAARGYVLVHAHGMLIAVDQATAASRWQTPALGLPAATQEAPGLVVPEAGGFVVRDPATGAERARWHVSPDLAAGGSATVVGRAVVYRLPGRVLGYR